MAENEDFDAWLREHGYDQQQDKPKEYYDSIENTEDNPCVGEPNGERIKIARQRAKMSQAELGRAVGVSGVAIMRYEHGERTPDFRKLADIAKATGVSYEYLLGLESINARDLGAAMRRGDIAAIERIMGLEPGTVFAIGPKGIKGKIPIDREDPVGLKIRLLSVYNKLNFEGQKKAVEQLELLLGNPKYSLDGDNDAAQE